MKKHEAKLSELTEYFYSHELYGSYGDGVCKTLKVIVHPVSKRIDYEVYDHRKLVTMTQDINSAIARYNNL